MLNTPVLVVGGGPVGMTVAFELARRGIRSILIERNATTTSHPKMDITNGRTMELFRRMGLADVLRKVAVDENNPFDVSWVTTMSGHELHRFAYPSVTQHRADIRATNDGTQPLEPSMRVSQVEIEPVLKKAIDASPLIDVRFGTEFVDLVEHDDRVVATVRNNDDGSTYDIACTYLAACDGGTSRVRRCLDIGLSGQSNIMPRFMTHFRSDARALLQRWGVAWHYQSVNGTLIAQNDKDIWTLHSRFPEGADVETFNPSELVERFAGTSFDHQIIVANKWSPHLLVADAYSRGRIMLAGDSAHQYIPTGGYGMNTGIGDAFDLAWKLAAMLSGFGGPHLLSSYEAERRPVGLRNRDASGGHNEVRIKVAGLYGDHLLAAGADGDAARANASAEIRRLGNAENESRGIEYGYVYSATPIIESEAGEPSLSSRDYHPTTLPGARLPSTFLRDGTALYDRLDDWFTLLVFNADDASAFERAARDCHVPLRIVTVSDPDIAAVYEANLVLVRPDQHVGWRGDRMPDQRAASAILRKCLGW